MALGNVIGSQHRQHPADPRRERDDPPAHDGRHHDDRDLLMVVLSSVLLLLDGLHRSNAGSRSTAWEGAIFLAIYVAYIGYLIR